MSYTPKTWTTGETITAAELNAIEQGVGAAAATADVGTAGTATGDALRAAFVAHAPPPSGDATGAQDTAALQGLIAAASTAGGGMITIPAGVYQLTGLSVPSLVNLRGYGRSITTLKRVGSGTGPFIKTAEWDTRHGLDSTTGAPYEFGLRDLTIDANHLGGQSTGYALAIHGRRYYLQGLDVINSPSCGLWSEYGPNLVAEPFPEAYIGDVRVLNCDGDGTSVIRFRGPSDSMINKLITAAPGSTVADSASVWHVLVDANAWNSIFTDIHCWGRPGLGFRNDVPVELNNPNLEPVCTTGTTICLNPNTNDFQYGTRVIGGTLFYAGPDTGRPTAKGVVFGSAAQAAWNVSMIGTHMVHLGGGALDWTHHDTASSLIDVFITEQSSTARAGGPQVGQAPGAVTVRVLHDLGGGPTAYSMSHSQTAGVMEQANPASPIYSYRENWQGSTAELLRVERKWDNTFVGYPPAFRVFKDYVQYGTDAAGVVERWGTGSPQGVYAGAPGSIFHRTDGGAGTCLYVKESGTGNSGWVAK